MAIAIRGTPQEGANNNGGDVTLTFDVAPLTDDVVIVFGGHGVATTTLAAPGSGYTQIGIHTGTAPIFGAWYKVMGATPDTDVLCSGGGDNADGVSYFSWVVSGVDTASVLDQTTVTVGPTTSTNPNCGTIVAQTTHALVLAMAGSAVFDSGVGTISGYANQIARTRNETNVLTAAGGTFDNPEADSEDPGAWSTWASGTWYALTAALREAAAAGDIEAASRFLGPSIVRGHPLVNLAGMTPSCFEE